LIAILAVNTSYCQYPIIKKIKDDTVVILTLNQSEQINKLYLKYNDTIGNLKTTLNKTIDSLNNKKLKYDSLFNTLLVEKDSIYNWKWKYKANKETYIKRESDFDEYKKYDQYIKYILVAIIYFQFTKLK
jgi:hypothetical protein